MLITFKSVDINFQTYSIGATSPTASGDNAVDEEDFCYDFDVNGILDGSSGAEIENLDAIGADGRQLFEVPMRNGHIVKVTFPKFLRTREQAEKTETPDKYTL